MSKTIKSEAIFKHPLPEYRTINHGELRSRPVALVYGCALPAELQAERDEAARQEQIAAARRAVEAIEAQLGKGSACLIIG